MSSQYLLGWHRNARPDCASSSRGNPSNVINFFFFLAEQVRHTMAELGFRNFDEVVGRVDMLDFEPAVEHWKAGGSIFLQFCIASGSFARVTSFVQAQDHGLDDALDHKSSKPLAVAIDTLTPVEISCQCGNIHRAVALC